jgi:type I restriction enzyme, S subunit
MKQGWEVRRLGDLVEILDTKRKPITKRDRNPGEFPYYGATGIVDYVDGYIFDEQLILLGEDGAKWNSGDQSAFIITGKTWVNNHAHVLKPYRDILNDQWLVYNLNHQNLLSFVTGLTVPKLNQGQTKKILIPLPPLEEQKQIVIKLDQCFEAIDKARANAAKNLENAKELFQSKLNDIFSQKGEGWVENKLGEITTKIGSGATPRGGQSSYKESGISLIRSLNVYDDGFREKKLAFIDDAQAEKLNNVTIERDDVLLNITGASVARCCIAPNDFLPARVNQHVSIIRLKKDTMSSEFLHYLLTATINKNILLGIGEQGSTRQAITKTQIQNFIVSYPEGDKEQEQSVESINRLKEQTQSLEFKYQQELNSLEELKKSILQKAFEGEL